MKQDSSLKWFAARMIRDRSYVLRFLEHEGWETSQIADIPTLVFLHGTLHDAELLRSALYDKALFYRTPDKSRIESIPDPVMQTFLIMAPFHNQPVIYLPVDDPTFFEGKKKRVVAGPFKGCEGTIKRIKGERRLIVRLGDRAAIATPYIPKECLADVEGE